LPPYLARHYDIEVRAFDQASKYLDTKYQLGWRVVKMTPHPDGKQLIFLLEKLPPPPKE